MKKFLNKEISAISYAKSTSSEISNSVFRLHVLANSDSSEDQNLKYKVRDKLISYMNTICSATTSKKEAIPCKIYDWRANKSLEFKSMVRE